MDEEYERPCIYSSYYLSNAPISNGALARVSKNGDSRYPNLFVGILHHFCIRLAGAAFFTTTGIRHSLRPKCVKHMQTMTESALPTKLSARTCSNWIGSKLVYNYVVFSPNFQNQIPVLLQWLDRFSISRYDLRKLHFDQSVVCFCFVHFGSKLQSYLLTSEIRLPRKFTNVSLKGIMYSTSIAI